MCLYNFDNKVFFFKAKTEEDNNFLQQCVDDAEFHAYISDEENYDNYKIISDGKDNIGVFLCESEINIGIKTVKPIIYIQKKKTITSALSIIAIMDYSFNELNADRISIQVFENNRHMNRIMQRYGFVYEGVMPFCKRLDNKYIGLNYYSLLRREYMDLCLRYYS